MGNGFDLNALNLLDNIVNIPIIISGGYGKPKHIKSLKKIKNLSGVAISSALHYSIKDELNIKTHTSSEGNFSFFLKKTSYKNFKNIKIKNLKKIDTEKFMNDVAILNYNMGNLRSIKAACDKVDLKSIITNDTEIIMNSKSLLLPGVGAYNQAMEN